MNDLFKKFFKDFPGGPVVKTLRVEKKKGICAPNAGSTGLILGGGTKILHASWHSQKKSFP